MTARRRTLDDLTGWAERGGYIYAVLLRSGIVRVGRTDDARTTITALRKEARANGTDLSDWWVSVPHAEWVANERALIETCHVLGGKRTGPGCFAGADFGLLTGKAHDLPYTSTAAYAYGRRPRRGGDLPPDKRMALAVRYCAEGMSLRQAAGRLKVSYVTVKRDLERWEREGASMPLEIVRLSRPPVTAPCYMNPLSEADVTAPRNSEADVIPLRRLA